MATWEKGYNPNQLASAFEEAKIVGKDGKVSFQGFTHYGYSVVLSSMVSLNKEIPDLEKKRIIDQATFKAGAKGRITAPGLLSEISKLESEYLRRPAQKYKLVTSISVSRLCKLKKVRIYGCTISFSSTISPIYTQGISEIKGHAQYPIVGEIPNNYTCVNVSVSAKSQAEAANKALDVLDLIRGIWNFSYNRTVGIRISSGKRAPVNKFILGPLHTLHYPDGRLATKSWWYDAEYTGPIRPYNPHREIEKIYKFYTKMRRLIQKNNYSKDLKKAILRYTRALDLTNWEDAFLRLWSVLEHLINTGFDSYKVTVRRASFIFGGEEYARQVLTHLRDYRNRAVHAGSEDHDIEAYMYQLKRFVEALLEFHVTSRFGFKNLAEAAEFMDLPCDKGQLCTRAKMLSYAEKFLRYS